MRPLGQPTLDHLAQSGGVTARLLVTLTARDPAAGSMVEIAMWSGEVDRAFTVAGALRSFTSVGDAIQMEPVEYSISLDARRHRIQFVGLPAETEGLLSNLDLRLAPIEVWRVILAPEVEVEQPHRLLRGRVDGVSVRTGKDDGPGEIVLETASSAMSLMRAIIRKWSDAVQRRRAPGTFTDTPVVITSSGSVPIAAQTEIIGLEMVGGGGGGGSASSYDGSSIAGIAGGATISRLMDGSAQAAVWQALGGAGGYGGAGTTAGSTSDMTPAGDGGSGQPQGGNRGADWLNQQGGMAGQHTVIDKYSIAGLTAPVLDVTIGAGGSGYQPGNAGKVILHQYARTGPADGFFRYVATAGEIAIEWK